MPDLRVNLGTAAYKEDTLLTKWILKVEGFTYLCSENKGAYMSAAPLFSHLQKADFFMTQLN